MMANNCARDVTNYIPEEITKAEKQGFSSPDASWFKGESIDFVKQKLSNPKSQLYEFFIKNHKIISGRPL